MIIRKGYHNDVDSFSPSSKTNGGPAQAFPLSEEREIDTLHHYRYPLDFCITWTALDARDAGFDVYVVDDASAASIWSARCAKASKT